MYIVFSVYFTEEGD